LVSLDEREGEIVVDVKAKQMVEELLLGSRGKQHGRKRALVSNTAGRERERRKNSNPFNLPLRKAASRVSFPSSSRLVVVHG